MNKFTYKTQSANEKIVERKWHIVDATNQTVGRMASQIATILRGKNKAYYTPHFDCGDYVIIINSSKVQFTGKKMNDKEYITFSGYPGGQKRTTADKILKKKPNYILEEAIKGMLPKNKLGRAMYKKLFIYDGAEHPHGAQQPVSLTLNEKKS